MSKRTLFLIFALFIITCVLLAMALYQPQPSKIIPAAPTLTEPVAQTTLSFGTPTIATSSSILFSNYTVPVNISTGKNKVTAIQLELQYDQALSSVSVVPGSFFAKPTTLLNQVDANTGRVTYALGIGPTDQPAVGKGVVAYLNFTVKARTPAEVAVIFLPKTMVTAEGVNETVLKQTANGLFTVEETISSPSAQNSKPLQ